MTAAALARPTVLAVVVTLANAAKPVVIDDTAYLTFARHLSVHPLDPYGFELYWYDAPEPAMGVLLPPVLPYWLALGMWIFGENVVLLKLWLFPWLWLLAWSLHGLLHRFARGTASMMLPLLMLSPAVLATVNLMLDVPALALGFAALRVFIVNGQRPSCDSRENQKVNATRAPVILTGVLAALAMQTKYTMLLMPIVVVWYGATHRTLRPALFSMVIAVAGFACWEVVLWGAYGQSHFVLHATAQASGREDVLSNKLALFAPLAASLGCLAFGFTMVAARSVAVPRAIPIVLACAFVVGVGLIAVLPLQATVLLPGRDGGSAKLTLASLVWRSAGAVVLLLAVAAAARLLTRWHHGLSMRRNADSLFVVGWLVLELGGFFVLTPFPAARRVLGVSLALGVLVARLLSRIRRVNPMYCPPRWAEVFAVALGVSVAALDTYDAVPERVIALRAAATAQDQFTGSRVWYSGHWGFQYYCERAGMRPIVMEETWLDPGDVVVLPVFPEQSGFYRPNNYHVPLPPPPWVADPVAEFVWDDRISAVTIPAFYGGNEPITGRDGPRLRVMMYRMTQAWRVGDYDPPLGRGWR